MNCFKQSSLLIFNSLPCSSSFFPSTKTQGRWRERKRKEDGEKENARKVERKKTQGRWRERKRKEGGEKENARKMERKKVRNEKTKKTEKNLKKADFTVNSSSSWILNTSTKLFVSHSFLLVLSFHSIFPLPLPNSLTLSLPLTTSLFLFNNHSLEAEPVT